MEPEEQYLRFGFYVGLATRLLGDYSYLDRWHGRGETEVLTDPEYSHVVDEIHGRLVAAGFAKADEDVYETELHKMRSR